MYHIVYQSCAVGEPTTAELKLLLQQARANNSRLDITGLLLCSNNNFLQVLEGPDDAVQLTYARIAADRRHTRIRKMADGPIQTRVFSNWSMGFQKISGEDFARLTGYIHPHRSTFLDAHLPEIDEAMLLLLKSFMVEGSARL